MHTEDLSGACDHTPAVYSSDSTVAIPHVGDLIDTRVIKQDFSGKTNMDGDQLRQLGGLACVVFCTKKQKRRKPISRISWLRRRYAMAVKILNIQLLKLPGLI